MKPIQREVLSNILQELDYPILAQNTTECDSDLALSYAKLAEHRAKKIGRQDLIYTLYEWNVLQAEGVHLP